MRKVVLDWPHPGGNRLAASTGATKPDHPLRTAHPVKLSVLALVLTALIVEVKPGPSGISLDATDPRGPLFVQEYVLAAVVGVAWLSRQDRVRSGTALAPRRLAIVFAYWAATVLVAALLLSIPFMGGAWGGVRMLAEGIVAFLVISAFRWRHDDVSRILFVFIIAMVAHSIILWLDFVSPGSVPFATVILDNGANNLRYSGHFLQPSRAGFMLAIALVGCLALAMWGGSGRIRRVVCYSSAPVLFGGLLLTQTRGAILASVFGIAYVLWATKKHFALVWLVVFGALASLVGAVERLEVVRLGLERFFGAGGTAGGGVSRTSVYSVAVDLIAQYPLGSGAGAIFDFSGQLRIPHAHNMYLQVAVMFGIPGLVLFLLWVVAVFRTHRFLARTSARDEVMILVGLRSVLVVCLAAFLTEPFLITNVGLWFWVFAGLLIGLEGGGDDKGLLRIEHG